MAANSMVEYLGTALVAGVVGGVAMEIVMWLIRRASSVKGDMILALGSLITKKRENGYQVGWLVHAGVAIVFGFLYTYLLVTLGYTHLMLSVAVGLGIGAIHGIMVSLMLVWVVADQHPLEEFKEADLLIGLAHVVAHIAFGGAIGWVVGFSPLS